LLKTSDSAIQNVMPSEEPNRGLERVKFQLWTDGVRRESPNPLRSGVHTRGFLPHVKREGSAYFVTFRLADSLPREVVLRFEQERAAAISELAGKTSGEQVDEINRESRRKIERYLDRGVGGCHLRRSDIADMVAEALRYFHGEEYLLNEWVVMPNHVLSSFGQCRISH
jgi:hypothetical protein